MRRLAALVLLLALPPATAEAGDPVSTFALDARAAALGGASWTLQDPAGAALANPAAAGLVEGTSLRLGYMFSHPIVSYNGEQVDLPGASGLTLELAAPLLDARSLGQRLRIGLAVGLHVPDRTLARIWLVEPTRPTFVMWEGPVQRIVANVVLAISWGDLVSVGGGATFLADGAAAARLDLGFEGAQTRTDADLDLALRLRAAPVFGILVSPLPWITLAAGYTGEIGLDMALDVVADIDAPGLEGDAVFSIRGTNDYTPPTVWVALGGRPTSWLDLHLQATYSLWHRANPFFADARILLDLGPDPSIIGGTFPHQKLEDGWSLAFGIEARTSLPRHTRIAFKGGYQYRPTPVPDQTGATTWADTDVHLWSTGLGFETDPERRVRLEASWAFQLQWLAPREVEKDPDVFVTTGYAIEGIVIASMLDLTLVF